MGCPTCKSITLFKGTTGDAATVAAGTTTTLAAGASATVVNSGTTSTAVLDFGIPQGAVGATGAAGATGATGAQGATGGYSGLWLYDTGTAPGTASGDFRFNNATPGSVTTLYINDTDSTAGAMQAFLDAFDNSGSFGLIKITKQSDASVFWVGKVTAEADLGSEHSVTVTYVTNNGAFTNNDACVVSFVESGVDKAAPYLKFYTALITQSGTSAPVAVVPSGPRAASDYLGDIVWTRDSAGVYIGTLSGVFTGAVLCSVTQGSVGTPAAGTIQLSRNDDNTVKLYVFNASGVATDALLNNANIEIKQYAT